MSQLIGKENSGAQKKLDYFESAYSSSNLATQKRIDGLFLTLLAAFPAPRPAVQLV